jgi:hypothetical protein
MNTRKKFLHKYRINRITYRGGKKGGIPRPPRPPRAPRPQRTPNPKRAQTAPNPQSKRSQKKARAAARQTQTPEQRAQIAQRKKEEGLARFAESGRQSRAEKKAAKQQTPQQRQQIQNARPKRNLTNKNRANAKKRENAKIARQKKEQQNAATRKAARKKKNDDAKAAAKKRKQNAANPSKKRMFPPFLSAGGALSSLANMIGKALAGLLDALKDLLKGLAGALFGGLGAAKALQGLSSGLGMGDVNNGSNGSCNSEQASIKANADAVRAESLKNYPTNPNIDDILRADVIWKKTMDSAKPPIKNNCEAPEKVDDNENKADVSNATVPSSLSDEEFLDGWRRCELIIELENINKNTTYGMISKAIERTLNKVKSDDDKSAIYAASRVILDPTNTQRYLRIISR